MYNKPKYSIFKNTIYALQGLKEIYKNESSFKLQILFFMIMNLILLTINLNIKSKLILFISLFIPLISEIINSAIERVVDLVTKDYNKLAKNAKDAGAALVFISFVITVIIWSSVLYINFIGI